MTYLQFYAAVVAVKSEIKVLLFTVILCMQTVIVHAQPPTYIWAKTLPGNVETIQRAILTDVSGNVYISGVFFGTVDFDPGAGVSAITPSPYGCNIYIAKYDPNGNYIWARNIPIAASYGGSSMTLDGSGNIYITGFFSGSNMDFDPGAGLAGLSSAGGNDIYIAKYDGNGNYLWATSIGSTGDDRGNEIITDAAGNIFITGSFSLTVDFDPGAGTAALTAYGASDIFLSKFSSNGVLQWVKQIGGTTTDDSRDIALDNSGNIILTGLFTGTADFDPGSGTAQLTSAGGNDIFIARYDASGNYVWACGFGGSNSDGGSAVKIDATGNVVVSGIFMGTVDFDPGSAVMNLTAASSATFYGKYDSNGNYLWVKQLPINYYNSDVALTATGNIFISGYYGGGYSSPIDMDPGAGVANLAVPTNLPPPTYNILGYYDALGNYLWAGVFGRQCYCSVMGYKSSIYVDAAGYLYYAGIFNGPWGSGTVDFDPGAGTANLNAPSSVDNAFFAKYNVANNPLPVSLLFFNGEILKSGHHLVWVTGSEINNNYFDIEQSVNGVEFNSIGRVPGHGTSNRQHRYEFDNWVPHAGKNYYRLKQVDYNGDSNYSPVVLLENQQHDDNWYVTPTGEAGRYYLHGNNLGNGIIFIFDMQGRQVEKINTAGQEDMILIDLSHHSGAMFIIQFFDESQVEVKIRNLKLKIFNSLISNP